jgi:hypothetical protein
VSTGSYLPSPAPFRPRPNLVSKPRRRQWQRHKKPLNVTDALSYLDAVKIQFPNIYNHFLDIIRVNCTSFLQSYTPSPSSPTLYLPLLSSTPSPAQPLTPQNRIDTPGVTKRVTNNRTHPPHKRPVPLLRPHQMRPRLPTRHLRRLPRASQFLHSRLIPRAS